MIASPSIAVIGAGPAGLMLAERLSAAGVRVDIYDRMPSVARKFLMAGRGGLNLTHSEPLAAFIGRYGAQAAVLKPVIEAFPPRALRDWADGLCADTFVGTSGRVFPKALKASPLLRQWLTRLEAKGVRFHQRHTWTGWDGSALMFDHMGQSVRVAADVTVLALGGASWPRLGSDGGWTRLLNENGVPVAPLRPANMGFRVSWSALLRDKFAGEALKNVALTFDGRTRKGELMLTRDGVEGGLIYAFAAALRDAIERKGAAMVSLDLKPEWSEAQIQNRLSRGAKNDSLSNRLRKTLNLTPAQIAVLREGDQPVTPPLIPSLIKAVPLTLIGAQGLERAISSAGGIRFDALTADYELKALPGVYAIGEMLDWEAPTGGYLLQACFSQAVWTAEAILQKSNKSHSV
ncbi:NAD(P)/FAD-dependent oxidoreductase [Asticcacaulis excentricus]|uniref:HI0933 family protein n=1 Tax=Asticcacaulis excentricus (strain ATCC 15261 / DSM 4724 / KCTC 12464 / NCIMB 9791 / VKM B-1370 / CB 48) TaxID=573065 RepID=E8RTL5_ASTEC|nr:TIGR03862 family flavoprotein [Asticcacaulis excentricus]ADU14836.1 HI0933 family protein [Asticcacaulis excentricus CB 48]